MRSSDEQFLRLAMALAHQARQRGADPFGAVLVVDGAVVHQAWDRSVELSDPTYHAELSLISEHCRSHRRFSSEMFLLISWAEFVTETASLISVTIKNAQERSRSRGACL